MRNLLILHDAVHACMASRRSTLRRPRRTLSDNEDLIQFVELRGQARVAGGLGSVSSIDARDIDLDYADDGQTIERASLRGASTVVMTANAGAAGRRVRGEQLDVSMRADSSLERLIGNGGVAMTLPAAEKSPAAPCRSDTLDASGDATAR